MLTWVVGAGGLLGSAVTRACGRVFEGAARVPWETPADAVDVLTSDLARFVDAGADDEWAVVWAAGSAVVESERAALAGETEILERFLGALRTRRPTGSGAFFLASSAGGVYAGSEHPPFSEATPPRPISPYGDAKLAQEQLAEATLAERIPLVIGRFSNLYGPGQNLAKPQGLVSRLCLAAAARRPITIFVPMETLRDYLFADDAGAMTAAVIARATEVQPAAPIVRNLASEQPTTVAYLVRLVQQVARHPIGVALAVPTNPEAHVSDLRIVSRARDEGTPLKTTPLPVGVRRVYEHTLATVQHTRMSAAV